MRSWVEARRAAAVLAVAAALAGPGCGNPGLDTPFVGRASDQPLISRVSFLEVTTPLHPYDGFAAYAGVLDDCVYQGKREESCTLLRLPPIGLSQPRPSVDDIMSRVLVSHDWMGTRFREVLESLPEELLLLFRPLTAVVISTDVRPSFYWGATGAIYLDSANLWLTAEEQRTVTTRPDFRSGFDDELAFSMPWRYVVGTRYAYRARPRPGAVRSFEDVRLRMARLLYHELGHANDYLTPARLSGLSPYQTFQRTFSADVQTELYQRLPLRSTLMFDVAQVAFAGRSATPAQKALGPARIAQEFAGDGATDFYNFSTHAEDVAMVFEELMMAVTLGVDRDVAVTPRPAVAQPTGADYIVVWGQRNRVADAQVRERARLVAHRLLPEAFLDAAIDALPPPRQMRPGASWTDNVALSASGSLQWLDAAARREADESGVETGLDCATLMLGEGRLPPR
jgi:hypothetical protein